MTASPDVAIVGAGIVGAACATELAAAGLRVEVLEAEMVGGGATAAGMGHVVVLDDSDAQLELGRLSRRLWDELAPRLPPGCEVLRAGTIWVAADSEELEEAGRKRERYEASGVEAEVLDARALSEAEPRLRPGLAGGLLVPGDSVVYPPRAAAFLLEEARSRSAAVRVGARVARLYRGGAVLADGSRIAAGHVVCATGSLAPELVPGVPVRPRKGHLVITDRYPGFARHQLIELGYVRRAHAGEGDSVSFNVQPRATGQLLIGSSRQFGAADGGVEHRLVREMLLRALEYLPSLADVSAIRTWTGFRAATPDGLPLVGPWSETEGLWLATGHEGLGITTSLATAKILAAQILGAPAPIPVEPYLPARFAGADLGGSAAHG